MQNISLDLIISFAFTVIYLRVPLDHVLASPMQIAMAQVALKNLESLGVSTQVLFVGRQIAAVDHESSRR
jgi:ABC-type siderophore export system fused ATPase/permease subunit